MLFVFDCVSLQIMENFKNNKISFYEHLKPLLECGRGFYATNQAKGLLCTGAEIEPARWSQFINRKKNFTGHYVYKILKSLKLTPKTYREATGMRFTAEQIEELKCQKFIDHHKGFIRKLRQKGTPEDIRIFDNALDDPAGMAVLRKLFSG